MRLRMDDTSFVEEFLVEASVVFFSFDPGDPKCETLPTAVDGLFHIRLNGKDPYVVALKGDTEKPMVRSRPLEKNKTIVVDFDHVRSCINRLVHGCTVYAFFLFCQYGRGSVNHDTIGAI